MSKQEKRHYTQRQKAATLRTIDGWIKDAGGMEKVDTGQLIRKCVLVIGCSRRKAIEYISDLTGET